MNVVARIASVTILLAACSGGEQGQGHGSTDAPVFDGSMVLSDTWPDLAKRVRLLDDLIVSASPLIVRGWDAYADTYSGALPIGNDAEARRSFVDAVMSLGIASEPLREIGSRASAAQNAEARDYCGTKLIRLRLIGRFVLDALGDELNAARVDAASAELELFIGILQLCAESGDIGLYHMGATLSYHLLRLPELNSLHPGEGSARLRAMVESHLLRLELYYLEIGAACARQLRRSWQAASLSDESPFSPDAELIQRAAEFMVLCAALEEGPRTEFTERVNDLERWVDRQSFALRGLLSDVHDLTVLYLEVAASIHCCALALRDYEGSMPAEDRAARLLGEYHLRSENGGRHVVWTGPAEFGVATMRWPLPERR